MTNSSMVGFRRNPPSEDGEVWFTLFFRLIMDEETHAGPTFQINITEKELLAFCRGGIAIQCGIDEWSEKVSRDGQF